MKLLIFGDDTSEIKKLAEGKGFKIVTENPDIIASYGGDGTFMKSENKFPNIPKLILRKSRVCKKCFNIPNEEILERVIKKEFDIVKEPKIEGFTKNEKIIGLNEIVVHNSNPRMGIRYEIFVNGNKIGEEIIGDGVVCSTPFGSTGYYRSITDSFFEVGIGVAFNNSTEQADHMVLKDDSEILIKIIRGGALAYADNSDKEVSLKDGDEILIKKSDQTAKIVKIRK